MRVACVTGAANGIGLATSRLLAAAGLHVVLVDRLELVTERAEQLRAAGGRVDTVVADLADPDAVLGVAATVLELAGRCDVLVNNAGTHPKKAGERFPITELSLTDWDLVQRVNLTAPFLLCREFVPGMAAAGWGRIINVSSRAGRTYNPAAGAHYAASKAGLIGLTRTLAGELAPAGITVNCVAPGRITTVMAGQSSQAVVAAALAGIPLARLGSPDEVAAAIGFLAGDAAAYVTGAVLDVNGGGFMG